MPNLLTQTIEAPESPASEPPNPLLALRAQLPKFQERVKELLSSSTPQPKLSDTWTFTSNEHYLQIHPGQDETLVETLLKHSDGKYVQLTGNILYVNTHQLKILIDNGVAFDLVSETAGKKEAQTEKTNITCSHPYPKTHIIRIPDKKLLERAIAVFIRVPESRVTLPGQVMGVGDSHIRLLEEEGIPFEYV